MQHLYISYPPNDYDFAHRLVDDLQARGYVVFVDPVSQAGTMQWAAETRHAIRAAGVVIMILSPGEGRRVGIRHEGILANRQKKLCCVLLRSPGDVPRYLHNAKMLDFSGAYEGALAELLAVLPAPQALLSAPNPFPRRRPRRPPRQPEQARRRRRVVLVTSGIIGMLLCLALGIALGVIPV
jgi:hypothetical protein